MTARRAKAKAGTALAVEGERVVLRAPMRADEHEFVELRRASRDFLAPWEADIEGDDPFGPERFRRFMLGGRDDARERALVCRRSDGRIAGAISLSHIDSFTRRAVLGYWIGAPFARQGLMTEALQLVCVRAFAVLGLRRIDAYVVPENVASRGLLAKLGFRRDALVPGYRIVRGLARDHERWVLDAVAVPLARDGRARS